MSMLEKVQKEGGLSTWNMSKKDKLSLLAQLSKAYLKNRVKQKRSIVNDVLQSFNFDQMLGDLSNDNQDSFESNKY